jgi:hypothetical protein
MNFQHQKQIIINEQNFNNDMNVIHYLHQNDMNNMYQNMNNMHQNMNYMHQNYQVGN